MQNLLIVEDNDDRIESFKKYLSAYHISIAKTADEAIEYLKNNKYDMIFLDHDLGGKVFVNSNDSNTGYQVAKYIVTMDHKDIKIIVHSLNPVGVFNIKSILKEAEIIPFYQLLSIIKRNNVWNI